MLGYMKAYGQTHETPDGLFCWGGRLSRAMEMLSGATDEASKKRMEKAITKMMELAERDFIEGERAAADYKDLCASLGIQGQDLGPAECQCRYCQTVPGWFMEIEMWRHLP